MTLAERFWSKVDKSGDCWLWTASRDGRGYGHFGIKGKMEGSHRVSWWLDSGEWPKGLCVLHKCDNPLCVRPEHLFIGSQHENMADMSNKGRRSAGDKHSITQRGMNNGRSKLTEVQVLESRQLYSTGMFTQQTLAFLYGISQVHMGRILNKENWRHV